MPMTASGVEWPWSVTGDRRMDADTLLRRLGPVTAQVWCCLVRWRDKRLDVHTNTGHIHTTHATVVEDTKLSAVGVAKAFRRLRNIGLVDGGRWTQSTNRKGQPIDTWVYRVRGGAIPRGPHDPRAFWVPAEVEQWVTLHPGRGGRRQGAGRKPKSRERAEPMAQVSTSQVDPQTTQEKNQKGTPLANQKGTTTSICNSVCTSAFPTGKTRRAEGAPDVSSIEEGGAPVPTLRRPPPFPGDHVAPPAKVPAPPKLSPDLSDDALVAQLVFWYCRALDAKYPKPRGKKHFAQAGRFESQLVQAGRKLIEHGIAPAAWINFSIRKWRHDDGRRGPPHLRYVFNPTVIEAQRGWFARDEEECVGGRVIYGPRHRDLYLAYAEVTTRLRSVDPDDALAVHAVVEDVLPGGSWDRLVRFARAEAANTSKSLQARVEKGEWPW